MSEASTVTVTAAAATAATDVAPPPESFNFAQHIRGAER